MMESVDGTDWSRSADPLIPDSFTPLFPLTSPELDPMEKVVKSTGAISSATFCAIESF